MSMLYVLIPLAVLLLAVAIWALIWAVLLGIGLGDLSLRLDRSILVER